MSCLNASKANHANATPAIAQAQPPLSGLTSTLMALAARRWEQLHGAQQERPRQMARLLVSSPKH